MNHIADYDGLILTYVVMLECCFYMWFYQELWPQVN